MKKQGFTIVELLVIIVVVAILAVISVFAYNGVQAGARDADRISDLQEIADAIKLNRVKNNTDISTGSGCGSSNNGGGWFNHETTSTTSYSRSILHCLTDAGYLNESFVDPTGCATTGGVAAPGYSCSKQGYAYMKYTCTYQGQTISIIYARLETKNESAKLTGFDNGNNTCSSNFVAAAPYLMNYMVIAD